MTPSKTKTGPVSQQGKSATSGPTNPLGVSFLWSTEFMKNVLAGVVASFIFWAVPLSIVVLGNLLSDAPTVQILSKVFISIAALLYLTIAWTAQSQFMDKDSKIKGIPRVVVLVIVWGLAAALLLAAGLSLFHTR